MHSEYGTDKSTLLYTYIYLSCDVYRETLGKIQVFVNRKRRPIISVKQSYPIMKTTTFLKAFITTIALFACGSKDLLAQVKVGANPGTISTNSVLDVEGTSGTRAVILQNGNMGVGTTSPGTKLEINNGSTAGAIKIVDGTQGASKVLMSDANGVGTWQTPASIRTTIIGTFPSTGQTIIPNGSSSPIYSQVYIDLPQGRWIVSAGLTISYFIANSRLWLHTYLSSSTTSIAQSGFTHLGPSGIYTSIAGALTNNTALTTGVLNFLPGSSVINVTASTGVRIYLMVENSATGSWSLNTANYEMYFYALPIN